MLLMAAAMRSRFNMCILEKKVRKTILTAVFALALLGSCRTAPAPAVPELVSRTSPVPAVSGLVSLDDAVAAAAAEVEATVEDGSEVVVYKITARPDEIGDFFAEELNDRFSRGKKLVLLARETALNYVDGEHEFQMSSFVSDEDAVGIGHYLGAKVVITGTFDRYAEFSQLRIRAVDVRTSALLASYTARISNDDPVLANITAPFGASPLPQVAENALDYLNRGKDLYTEGKYDKAIQEFDRALAIDSGLFEGYFYRGVAYRNKGDNDRAIADHTAAIRINPNYADAYNNRGVAYRKKGDNDQAIADYNVAIRINPNLADAYSNRGDAYYNKGDYDRAVVDYTEAVRINPNYVKAYYSRGLSYANKREYDRAIADYTEAIRINPNLAHVYGNRGIAYANKGELDRAIADWNTTIRINPNLAEAYFNRGIAYRNKGDYGRAIADWEAVLRIDPNNIVARQNIEKARQMQQGQ